MRESKEEKGKENSQRITQCEREKTKRGTIERAPEKEETRNRWRWRKEREKRCHHIE